MPTIPKIVTLSNNSVDVLNAIRNSATTDYRKYVPVATEDSDSIMEIGATIMDNPSLQNEFLTALVNRIGRVILTSKLYENPWSMFKQGMLEFGETIEEIFVNIAKPYQFSPKTAETEVFKREIPDVRSAFHVMNFQKFYKATVTTDQLRQAFLSWQGITDLIAKIVDAMYTGANYDEFQVMKYMLAKKILRGEMTPVTIPPVATANMKEIVSDIKATSNNFQFMSTKYNRTGVQTFTDKGNQYIILSSNFDASMDVEVLASAFNMNKADFMGQRVLIDGFGSLDIDRLNELFDGDTTYTEISQDELDALNEIPCVMVDKEFFMIFDNFQEFTENYNGQGLYWNYFYHTWKTFSVSPFKNNAIFIPDTPTVTSVSVSPDTATIKAGQSVQLVATVETTNFAPQEVNWTITSGTNATVNASGVVTLLSTAVTGATITVTATSVYDTAVSDSAEITVG